MCPEIWESLVTQWVTYKPNTFLGVRKNSEKIVVERDKVDQKEAPKMGDIVTLNTRGKASGSHLSGC